LARFGQDTPNQGLPLHHETKGVKWRGVAARGRRGERSHRRPWALAFAL